MELKGNYFGTSWLALVYSLAVHVLLVYEFKIVVEGTLNKFLDIFYTISGREKPEIGISKEVHLYSGKILQL